MTNGDIFNINSEQEFLEASLDTFRYQYENTEVYRKFVDFLNVNPREVLSLETIPFLPIEVFKNHTVIDKNQIPTLFFQSSGTADIKIRSKHYISEPVLYEQSILNGFKHFIGEPEEYIFLGLLPNYSANPNSSLIYMVDFLMKKSGAAENGYFLQNHRELYHLIQQLKHRKIILFGVSFALLDFLDSMKEMGIALEFTDNLTVIETGGMKGRKQEMTKEELLTILQNGFNTKQIFSEYSMTELLSQAYSLENQIYHSPNWMKVMIRNTDDPFSYREPGKTGGINIIDLANRHSCSFIATQDMGKLAQSPENKQHIHSGFQVLGRIDHSDLRGCSMLVS